MSVEEFKKLHDVPWKCGRAAMGIGPKRSLPPTTSTIGEPDVEGAISDKNLQEWSTLVKGYHQSFGNSRVRILDQIAEGEEVASHWEFTATHVGDFLGHPANNRRVTWTEVRIDRFDSGRIAERWVSCDKYRLPDDLGFIGQNE